MVSIDKLLGEEICEGRGWDGRGLDGRGWTGRGGDGRGWDGRSWDGIVGKCNGTVYD